MTTARDIMTPDAECAHADDTLVDAARRMRDLGVGALPVCGPDERLQGMVTDRDIVVKCIAEGGDLTPPRPVCRISPRVLRSRSARTTTWTRRSRPW
jgi:CBS domain-containing protein